MSITAECNACGRKYQAPASLAGKRVRCKQCGNIFSLPLADASEPGPDLDGLANLEKSFHSMDATATGAEAPSDDENEDHDSPGALRNARMNVRFNFPFAREVDQWLPLVLTILGLLWLGKQGYQMEINSDSTLKKWIAATRVGLAFLGFVLIIWPLTLAAIRAAGRQLDYRMPHNDRLRAFACLIPGFALTYIMWANGGGDIGPLILGGIAGILLSIGFVWLLFRLRPHEIAPTAGYTAAGYFGGLLITAILLVGLNFVGRQAILSAKRADLVPHSPFAQGVAWLSEQELVNAMPKKLIPTSNPAPTTANTVDNSNPTNDSGLTITSPVIKAAKAAPIPGPFDSVIFPLIDAPYLATVRNGPQVTIDSWNTQAWTPIGSGLFPADANVPNRFALSPDGDRLALIAHFPTLSVQIWSFKEKRMLPLLYLENRPGISTDPELVGFVTPERLLTRWRSPNGYAFEVIDVVKRQQIYRLPIPNYEQNGYALVISPDGKLAALATKLPPSNKPTLIFFDLVNGKQLSTTTEIATLDVQFPVAPTGMAFSYDNKKIAILFEQAGNGLLLVYQFNSTTGAAEKIADNIFPAGPLPGRDLRQFSGNAMAWTPNNTAWIIYGQGVFSATTGLYISDLAMPGVERCRITLPDMIQIVGPWPPTPRQISSLQLDLDKITELATKK